MGTQAGTRPVTVELWARSLSPRGAGRRRSATVRRLERLEGDRIDGFRVRLWGDRIGHSTPEARTERGRAALERVATFREWADERGLTLSPFFEERTRESAFTDDGGRVLVLPEMALAEFRAGQLRRVSPCSDGDDSYAVDDHLSALAAGPESGDVGPTPAPTAGATPPEREGPP
jgi:hypothetical protein